MENWAKMSWKINYMDSSDKKMKMDKFKLQKIVLDTVRGDQFLYIALKFDYNVWFLIATVFLS